MLGILELSFNFKKIIEHINIYVFFMAIIFIFMMNIKSTGTPQEIASWLWIILLLTCIISSPLWWEEEGESGIIEQWRLSPVSMELIAIIKLAIHSLCILLPITILSYAIATYAPKGAEEGVEIASIGIMALGGLQLTATTMLAAASTRNGKRMAAMQAILVIPFAVPTIIFGTQALAASISHKTPQDIASEAFLLLLGYCGLTIPILILATAAQLRNGN